MATGSCWPTEVGSDSVDLVNEVFHAQDAVLAKTLLNHRVVVEGQALLVDLAESTLVDQLAHTLEVGVAIGNVWLDTLEHLRGGLGDLHEHTHVHLTQAHDLQDLLGLGVHVVETTDADNKCELGLAINKVVAGGLGLAVHAHTLLGQSAVLFDILLGRFVCWTRLSLLSFLAATAAAALSEASFSCVLRFLRTDSGTGAGMTNWVPH